MNFYEQIAKIDNLLARKEIIANDTEELLTLIKDDAIAKYFWSKIDKVQWFEHLLKAKYFSTETIPLQLKDGYIQDWLILPYLERLANQYKKGIKVPINEILEIIQYTTSECRKNPKKKNPRIWWYFIRILSNLNPKELASEIIELIPIWLDDINDQTLIGPEIVTLLLPLFINDKHIDKAEKILDYITAYKWIEHKNWDKKTARLAVEPYWIVDTLIKRSMAKEIGKFCSVDFICKFAKKLQKYLSEKYNSNWFDIKSKEIVYRIIMELESIDRCQYSIVAIPEETVQKEFFFSRVLRPKGCVIILEPIIIDTNIKLDIFLEKIASEIDKLQNIEQPLRTKIKESLKKLFKNVYHDYSFIWFKNLRTGDNFFSDQTDTTLVAILIDLILGKADKDKESTLKIFELFQSSEFPYPIFKRFIYHVLSKNWESYNPVFGEMLEKYGAEELFDNPNYGTDIHALLIENIDRFKPKEMEMLVKTIESGPWNYQVNEDGFDRTNIWRQSWYASLKADPFFKSYYKKYFNLTQVKETDVFSEGEVTYGPGPSPKSLEELIKLPEKELIKFLKDYKSDKTWKGPNLDGLSSQLVGLFRDNPEKIAESEKSYQKVPYIHMYHIFWGLKDACENKKNVSWQRVFWIMEDYLCNDEFWSGAWLREDDDWHADKKWVVGQFCELLSSGSKSNSSSFPFKDISKAEKILNIIFDHADDLRHQDRSEEGIGLNYALNSTMGKATKSLIDIFLFHARQVKEDSSLTKWLKNLKDKYDWLLDNKIIEAYTYLGAYLPNFYFLEKSWAESKVESMEHVQDQKLWSAFYYGYLHVGSIYQDVFSKMKPHYKKALEAATTEGNDNQRLIEHIGMAYLQGFEELNGPLFKMIVKNWNSNWIKHLIQLFGRHKDIKEGKFPERILGFWAECNKKIMSSELTDPDIEILSDLSHLICFIPYINKKYYEWINLSIQFVDTQFNYTYIIEYLNQVKDKGERIETAKRIASLFLVMLEKFTPDYKLEDIRSIIIYLFETPDEEVKRLTNKICEQYGRKGAWRICRDLFEKYNDPSDMT